VSTPAWRITVTPQLLPPSAVEVEGPASDGASTGSGRRARHLALLCASVVSRVVAADLEPLFTPTSELSEWSELLKGGVDEAAHEAKAHAADDNRLATTLKPATSAYAAPPHRQPSELPSPLRQHTEGGTDHSSWPLSAKADAAPLPLMPRRISTDNPAARKGATVTEAGVVTNEMATCFFKDLLRGSGEAAALDATMQVSRSTLPSLVSVDGFLCHLPAFSLM
jgi:hypothetical protein